MKTKIKTLPSLCALLFSKKTYIISHNHAPEGSGITKVKHPWGSEESSEPHRGGSKGGRRLPPFMICGAIKTITLLSLISLTTGCITNNKLAKKECSARELVRLEERNGFPSHEMTERSADWPGVVGCAQAVRGSASEQADRTRPERPSPNGLLLLAVAPVIAAAGIQAAGSGLSSAYGASQSQGSARRSRKFTREVMQNQRQWMVDDLKKAGINPMLASGASPTGHGSGGQTINAENPAAHAVQTAMQQEQLRGLRIENDLNEDKKGFFNVFWDAAKRGIEGAKDLLGAQGDDGHEGESSTAFDVLREPHQKRVIKAKPMPKPKVKSKITTVGKNRVVIER